ncbi:hypothetical protein M011DRAFT_473700 [Sporormia fimetaria CBS 119925]|uniref:ABM domain-containing protein n=1 Tax=Sporormia fimetaria CBS 119925 TaxID=1340428 RepID=A0A6A6VKP1_9PLEO|nr:hypothetical protein M011DRAFT_473700 [Sporormia fimetaria CBS 119925]
MSPKTKGISLHVEITVAPENVDKFLEALKPCYEAVIAEEKCTFFEVFHSAENPGVFKFVENWDATVEWLMANQLNKPYYKPYLEATEPMWIKPRTHHIWEVLEDQSWTYVSK